MPAPRSRVDAERVQFPGDRKLLGRGENTTPACSAVTQRAVGDPHPFGKLAKVAGAWVDLSIPQRAPGLQIGTVLSCRKSRSAHPLLFSPSWSLLQHSEAGPPIKTETSCDGRYQATFIAPAKNTAVLRSSLQQRIRRARRPSLSGLMRSDLVIMLVSDMVGRGDGQFDDLAVQENARASRVKHLIVDLAVPTNHLIDT